MEMLIIPAISPYLEQTGISSSKHFPCKALFTLETSINTISFQYQQHHKQAGRQRQRKPSVDLAPRVLLTPSFLSFAAGLKGTMAIAPLD